MSHSVPQQHPAVVLRSHYLHMRALLVFACIAVVGLTIAVVVLAIDNGNGTSTSSAASSQSAPAALTAPAARYDGGPDEGTSGATR